MMSSKGAKFLDSSSNPLIFAILPDERRGRNEVRSRLSEDLGRVRHDGCRAVAETRRNEALGRVIARTHERARRDESKAERLGLPLVVLELRGGHVARDLGVFG